MSITLTTFSMNDCGRKFVRLFLCSTSGINYSLQRIKIHIRSPHKKSFHLSLRALEMDETVMEINAILLAIYGKIQIDFFSSQ